MLLLVLIGAVSTALAPAASTREPTPAGAIVSDAAAFLGRRVAVEGRVRSVLDARLFTLEDAASTTLELPVVMPQVVPGAVLELGTRLTVTGRVWLASEHLLLGWPDLEPLRHEILALSGRPILVADSVRSTFGQELVPARPPIRSIGRIVTATDKPSLVGRAVSLRRVAIEDVITARSFVVRDANGYRILVELAETGAPHAAWVGERVDVDGVVRMSAAGVYPWSLFPAPDAATATEPLHVAAARVSESPPSTDEPW